MRKYFLAMVLLLLFNSIVAQNVGIGTTEPMNKLHVVGNLLVTTPTTATSTAPAAAQIQTMVNASTISFLNTDSTGRIYDPGGPAGNYLANMVAFASFDGFGTSIIGIEITAETMGLGTGDSLIIKESASSVNNLLAVGNGYTTTGKWVFNSTELYIIFKSNADANTGIGFSLLFKALYNNSSSLPDASGATGYALLFDTKKGYFRSGLINNSTAGSFSTAMGQSGTASGFTSTALGYETTASGDYSTAIGLQTTAAGNSSSAIGFGTIARGDYSTALGNQTIAIGVNSTALGYGTYASGGGSIAIGNLANATGSGSTAIGVLLTASGERSRALGYNSTASGSHSTAMGNYVSTNNHAGSFIIGDNSTTVVMNSANANNFRARFDGGYKLFTSSNLSTGCSLFAGDNAWTTGSDVRTKENFAEINGEDFLRKISGFHLTSWNYKTQNPKIFRHYGPMAQDFFAAFGRDKYGTIGNDTTINSADFAGVSFIAIQALEKRTQKIEALEKENEALKKMLLQLKKDVEILTGMKKENL